MDHSHYARRNSLALELLRAIDNFSKNNPELTPAEVVITQIEMLHQSMERRGLLENARERIIRAAIDYTHQNDSRAYEIELEEAVTAYCSCERVEGQIHDCPVHNWLGRQ